MFFLYYLLFILYTKLTDLNGANAHMDRFSLDGGGKYIESSWTHGDEGLLIAGIENPYVS